MSVLARGIPFPPLPESHSQLPRETMSRLSARSTPLFPSALTENAFCPDNGGTIGRHTQVAANFYSITKLPLSKIFHYAVDIKPYIPMQKARQVWAYLEHAPAFAQAPIRVAFDGRANAFAAFELQSIGLARTFEIVLQNKGTHLRAGGNAFQVKISFVATIETRELILFLNKRGPFTQACSTAIQALNAVLTHLPFSRMPNVGRSVFSAVDAIDLGKGVSKWDGIFQSIRPGQGVCFLNIDITAAPFLKGGNAAECMFEILGDQRPDRRYEEEDRVKLEHVLKGCIFTVDRGTYQPNFKLEQLSKFGADRTMFDMHVGDGRVDCVSVQEYFARTYNRQLCFPSLPCFGVKGRDSTSYFPAELCHINFGQHYKKKLDEEQTKTMVKATAVPPMARAAKIKESLRLFDFETNPYLRSFGVHISPEMTLVPARVLNPPAIEMANGTKAPVNEGCWRITRGFIHPARMDSWGVMCFESEGRARQDMIQSFVRKLVNVMTSAGMILIVLQPPIVYAQSHSSIKDQVELARRRVEIECGNRPAQMLLVIFPNKSKIYAVLKAYCETQPPGLLTQCTLLRHVLDPKDQYCRMLSMKINAKLGGVASALLVGEMPIMDKKNTLVIGADVSHPAPDQLGKPSIASVVASLDDAVAQFFGRVYVQNPRVEIIVNMQALVKNLIQTYKKLSGQHPKRILVYRDGVSDSQFAEILRTELKAVKDACTSLGPNYLPPITFIIVKKRHHARFFPEPQSQDCDRSGNCLAGTVVDKVITHPTEFTFYLQSHTGIQGTSRSTLYHVLWDENRFSSDALQQLTFNMCHMYSRCSRSLSIVPAVMYAHLLASRARHYLDCGIKPEVWQGQNQGRDSESEGTSADGTSTQTQGGDGMFGELKISEALLNQMFFV